VSYSADGGWHIYWAVELGGHLIGWLAGWAVGLYLCMEHVREYTYYIAYTLYTRARVRGFCSLVGCVCCMHCITILLLPMYSLLSMHLYGVYRMPHQWLVRITALCIKVDNALTIHGNAYSPSLLY